MVLGCSECILDAFVEKDTFATLTAGYKRCQNSQDTVTEHFRSVRGSVMLHNRQDFLRLIFQHLLHLQGSHSFCFCSGLLFYLGLVQKQVHI